MLRIFSLSLSEYKFVRSIYIGRPAVAVGSLNTCVEILHVGRQLRRFLAEDVQELGKDILRISIVAARTLVHEAMLLQIVHHGRAVGHRQTPALLAVHVLADANLLQRAGEKIVDFIVDRRRRLDEFAIVAKGGVPCS